MVKNYEVIKKNQINIIKKDFFRTDFLELANTYYDSSILVILSKTNISDGIFSFIYRLKNPLRGDDLLFIKNKQKYKINSRDTIITQSDTIYNTNTDISPDMPYIKLANSDDIIDIMKNSYLGNIKGPEFSGKVVNINNNQILISFSRNKRNSIKKNYILQTRRKYDNRKNGATHRLSDLNRRKELLDKSPNSMSYNKFYETTNMFDSNNELNSLVDSTHMLISNKTVVALVGLDILLKVNSIYDTTLTAIYYKNKYPYRELRAGDLVRLK